MRNLYNILNEHKYNRQKGVDLIFDVFPSLDKTSDDIEIVDPVTCRILLSLYTT